MRPFNCDDSQDPRNKFAHRFHEDCCIPAARIGLTNLQNPCAYHVDEMNSSMIQYECVPTFARYVIIENIRYWCALIGYSQRSVDNCLVQVEVHGPYVEFICNEYSKFPEEQKSLSPSLFSKGAVVECVSGLRLLQNPCNLDPWGHYSSIIKATLLLDRKFKLRLPERLSLLRAMGVTPNGAYLYVAAATALLEVSSINHRIGHGTYDEVALDSILSG